MQMRFVRSIRAAPDALAATVSGDRAGFDVGRVL